MGFLSKVWGGIKNVFNGVLKVFAPILKPIGKLFDSKIGKAIMAGLSIFTLGTSMIAGAGAFTQAAGQGFIQQFVEGGKAFMSSFVGKGGEEALGPTQELAAQTGQGVMESGATVANLETGAAGAVDAAAQAAVPGLEAGGQMTQGTVNAAGEMVSGGGSGGGLLSQAAELNKPMASGGAIGPTKAMAETGVGLATRTPPPEGSWLSKAAKAAGDFVTSEGGGRVTGALIEGIGGYYTEKDRQEFEDRIRRQWGKGDADAGIRNIRGAGERAANMRVPSAQTIGRTSRATAREGGSRPYFSRPYGAGAGV